VYQPKDSTLGLPLVLQPDLNDKRVPFYTTINTTAAPRFRINGFCNAVGSSFPIFLPGEMTLIKAECYVKGPAVNLASAKTELDKIINKTPAQDAWGVAAQLTGGYTGALSVAAMTDEIFKQRSIELFMSGFKLEDSRRLGRPVAERKRSFFPYPFKERDNNPNTPADPSF
jgi:starch-binding outer membrane protein, SusD/RagB family